MSATTLLNIQTAIGSITNYQSKAPVTLGGVALTGMETPSGIDLEGHQNLTVHELPDGGRIIDAMGVQHAPIELRGLFTGSTAQSRAQRIEAMRDAAKPVTLAFGTLSLQVVIRGFRWNYARMGFIIQYAVVLEPVVNSGTSTASTSTSALSNLIGSDATSALSGVMSAIASVSSTASSIASTAQSVIGQITPIANIIGVGGPLAHLTDSLTAVEGYASAGTNLAALPSAASGILTNLSAAASSVSTSISQAGANLEAISLTNGASLSAAAQNAGILSASADAGAQINRATTNTQVATNATITTPQVAA